MTKDTRSILAPHLIARFPSQNIQRLFDHSPSLRKSSFGLGGMEGIPIIAICHLNWDWVWQRPQQFLSRLSKHHPVLFVETHCTPTAQSFTRTRVAEGFPQVTLLEVHLPADRWNEGHFIDLERRRVLQDRLRQEFAGRYDQAILWFNDPMAVTAYAGHLGERLIVYDCMDELSQFLGAPEGLILRERALTIRADIVFCGGSKMRQRRLPLNPNTFFYGTGVDCDHFGTSLSSDLKTDATVATLPRPIMGYFGVIDERLDYELIEKLAEDNPGWSVVMVGPTAKVPIEKLPRKFNLHWLGAQPYAQLPAITKGFSVCLMPFALNAATEYINPTKTLEYMAAGRPVVSTAIDEVQARFSNVVRVAKNHEEFLTFCRLEVTEPSSVRIRQGMNLAYQNTWETIVENMRHDIARQLSRKQSAAIAPNCHGETSYEPAVSSLSYV